MNKRLPFPGIHALALCAACASAPLSAQAALTLTIPTQFLEANAIQAFSDRALKAFSAVDIEVSAAGNATAVADIPGAYNLPVTNISLQLVKVSGGASVGSALEFNRLNDFDENRKVVLANFKLDFNKKKVLADATYNGATQAATPVYDFQEQTALAIKYRFPLSITAHQVLDQLFLTPEAKTVFTQGLDLPPFTQPILNNTDFGTITVDVQVKVRKQPVSTKPYVPSP